jgi:hypothetical protein
MMTTTTNYADYKLQQLQEATTRRVFGHPLEHYENSRMAPNAQSKWFTLNPCLCVWDNDQNPCPCTRSTIWWILASDIVSSGKSDRKSHDGNELNYYDVNLNSQVIVESTKSVSLKSLMNKKRIPYKDLAKLIALIKSKKQNIESSSNGQRPGVIFSDSQPWWEILWEILEKFHELAGAAEYSGVDWGEVLEVGEGLLIGISIFL